jgi:hydroxymethylbilane synthase
LTAHKFVKTIREGTCLFPISNISNRTVQKAFANQNQTSDIIVYSTQEKQKLNIPQADILIFTSPSNVRSYYSRYRADNQQQVIAIGPSTGVELEKNGIIDYHIPNTIGETGLIDLITTLY